MDEIYEICVGFLCREPSAALHITFRDFDIMVRHRHNERQDMWDYTRHIMAAMGAGEGKPSNIIRLDRDRPDIDDEMISRAKQFLNRFSQKPN